MLNLEHLTSLYSSLFLGEELVHLQAIHKFKGWIYKTDIEKQERRKSYLRTAKIHFKESGIEYFEQSIIVTGSILEFLSRVNFSTMQYESCHTEVEKTIFRVCNMLWCEKEYILYMESPRATKIHVPMDVYEPLILKIENTKEYLDYKLDKLFDEYRKMLELSEFLSRS